MKDLPFFSWKIITQLTTSPKGKMTQNSKLKWEKAIAVSVTEINFFKVSNLDLKKKSFKKDEYADLQRNLYITIRNRSQHLFDFINQNIYIPIRIFNVTTKHVLISTKDWSGIKDTFVWISKCDSIVTKS